MLSSEIVVVLAMGGDIEKFGNYENIMMESAQSQVDIFVSPNGHGLICLVSDRTRLGCVMGNISPILCCASSDQVLVQSDRMAAQKTGHNNNMYLLPSGLDMHHDRHLKYCSFTNQVLAQLGRLRTSLNDYKNDGYSSFF